MDFKDVSSTSVSKRWIIIGVVVAVVTFIIGLLIGLYAPSRPEPKTVSGPDPEEKLMLEKLTREADPDVSQRFIQDIDPDKIRQHLEILTRRPHMGGEIGNFQTGDYVRDQWKDQGFDVHTASYQVLLSYPEENHNNTASLVAADGSVLFQSTPREVPFSDRETHPEAVQPFNAFAPSGSPKAELVYANYGRDVDFEELVRLGVNVTGKIVIAKYGEIFRGNKVEFAYQYGAVGVILFMDPKDYTNGKTTYPDNIWLPPTGVQRGNIVLIKGDQATPGYPAVWYTERLNETELNKKLPKIPCHPIGYSDAYMLLKEMDGMDAPEDWQGLLNFTYKLGGSMIGNKQVQLDVRNFRRTVTITNVFATIKGTIESDKVVFIGNHRDAWVYGGVDPSSGTAAMLEMSRVYGQQVKNGWKPRRTVVFCSWDAEEPGLVGSYEWVEENVKWLQNQAVTYLNIDAATMGNYTARISATPTLKQAVYRAAKKVPDPHAKGKAVYDVWKEREEDSENPGFPTVRLPGAGTDFVPFEQDVAVPTADFRYTYFDLGEDGIRTSGYPLYHTLYEGFEFVEMMDPEFRVHKAVSAFMLELARDIIDSPILPMDVRDYATAVNGFIKGLFDQQKDTFKLWNITSDAIQSAADNFTEAASTFHESLGKVDKMNPVEVRAVNEKLMTLEKAFQVHRGLPDRDEYKHVLLSPSSANYYKTTTFPGMADLLYQIGNNTERWQKVRQHLSVLTFCIQSAAKILTV